MANALEQTIPESNKTVTVNILTSKTLTVRTAMEGTMNGQNSKGSTNKTLTVTVTTAGAAADQNLNGLNPTTKTVTTKTAMLQQPRP